MELESTSPTRTATRDALRNSILQCWKHAKDAYDATHDSLTGILNSKSLEEIMLESLTPLDEIQGGAKDVVQSQVSQKTTALLSFDIDHFKQVNDSHGHDYGDIVLMVFAKRIQYIVELISNRNSNISLKFGRSGGEEFSIVATGGINEDLILEIADELRNCIGEKALPEEAEWNDLPQDYPNSLLAIPHISDRKITTSVGISSLVTPTQKSQSRKLAEKMRHEADAALYRAKSGGRNVVRYFPSIRDKYGSVIECHPDTGIIAIDIGKDFGVQPGHEFSIFHPDFTGDKYFVRSDGRSRKTLGKYPRISCGRLVVFNSQRDIAFCFVEGKTEGQSLAPGSSIQFIPAGSIKHLISGGFEGNPAISSRITAPQDFEATIKELSKNDAVFSVATLNLMNAVALEKSHGVSTTNKALADLFRAIETNLAPSSKISQISSFDISFFVTDCDRDELESKIEAIILDAENRSIGMGNFGCGIYCSQDEDIAHLNKAFGLDYSRFAASPLLRSSASKIGFFTEYTAEEILGAHRETRQYIDGQQDYAKLVLMGVEGPASFHNQGALCCFEGSRQNLEEASAAIDRALSLEYDVIYAANRGLIRFALGDFEEAEVSFEKIRREYPKYNLPEVYVPVVAMSSYHAFDGSPEELSRIRSLLEEAVNINILSGVKMTKRDMMNALATLAARGN